ncbi:pancreatic beta cell growth factor [Phodopus roborovskii]|uniref:Reg3d protein n=1 Tax=Phodopus roborovskii TaxID=109678 RepID=A0AAV0A0R8_PHORO|nr:pancreatic beta cell growth factor [Phodopus roborovskii]CAH7136011.1 Reg3d [Phodopus roborovskii]
MTPPMTLCSVSWMLLSCLMFLSLVEGEESQKKLPSSRITCPQGSVAFGSHCYSLILVPQTWPDAELFCQMHLSGHLAFLLSTGEVTFVSSLVKNSKTSYQYIWIGLHDPSYGTLPNGSGWTWSSSNVLTFYNWERNPSVAADHGYCAALSRNSGFQKWRDFNCETLLPYVCKFKP